LNNWFYIYNQTVTKMKLKIFATLALTLIVVNLSSQSKVYFVSPSGSDTNTGLSVKTAWKTLDKVNQVVFLPGDVILFESGKIWYGQLKPQGSGEKGKPIILGSYGGDDRPVINIGRSEGSGIRLTNQSWWEINNIEVTSGAPPELGIGRQGIVVIARGDNQNVEHITVRNCYIHDIWGQMGGNTEYTGYYSCGILVNIQRERGRARNQPVTTTINDILIENNRIERFDKCGIIVWGGKNNVVVRGNRMDNLGGDGIFVNGCDKGIIEYNVVKRACMRSGHPDLPGGETWWPHTAAIWIQDANETLMQFNQVYDTGRQLRNGDGNAYDFDFGCKRCILQYNYSKNNHGLLLIMYNTFENIARYNISENDKTHLIQLQCNISERNIIYNNVFYVDYGTADLDFFCGDDGSKDKSLLGGYIHNNIFYATGQGRFRTVYSSGQTWEREFNDSVKIQKVPGTLFHHNCYFGPWKNGLPDDPEKLVADPMFLAPGTGGEGLHTLGGYKLHPESPCINTGMLVPLSGSRDFFGNPLLDGSPDYGAFEQLGSGTFADASIAEELNRVYMAQSRLAWAKTIFPRVIRMPDEKGKIVVSLQEPLESQITGTLAWSDKNIKIKPSVIQLSKSLQRDSFVFTLPTNKIPVTQTSLHVSLQDQEFTEDWNIPFPSSPVR